LCVAFDLLPPTFVASTGYFGAFTRWGGVRQLVLGMGLWHVFHGHVVREMRLRWRVLRIVVWLRLASVRHDVLKLVVLEFVIVVLKLMLVRLHLPFMVL
jgi:hypothetical protein